MQCGCQPACTSETVNWGLTKILGARKPLSTAHHPEKKASSHTRNVLSSSSQVIAPRTKSSTPWLFESAFHRRRPTVRICLRTMKHVSGHVPKEDKFFLNSAYQDPSHSLPYTPATHLGLTFQPGLARSSDLLRAASHQHSDASKGS